MKTKDRKPKEEDPEPESNCCTLTLSAKLQPEPSASEPQITDSTTEPQTRRDPAANRTEPQEPDHLHQTCSVEMD